MEGNDNNIRRQWRMFHIFSLAIVLMAYIVYVSLDGGKGATSNTVSEGGISDEIPEISDDIDIGRTRRDNRDIAASLDKRESERKRAESSSFDWFDGEASVRATPDGGVSDSPADKSDEERLREARERSRRLMEGERVSYGGSGRSSSGGYGSSPRSVRSTGGSGDADDYVSRRRREVDSIRRENERMIAERGGEKRKKGGEKVEKEKRGPVAKVEVRERKKGFYGMESSASSGHDGIRAVVHGEHRNLRKGATVKMRILDNIRIGEKRIPRNTFVYGVLSFSNGRANIRIENINLEGDIIPFGGTIYDKDGFEGLYVPDNVVDETARKAGGDAVNSVDVNFSSPSSVVTSGIGAVAGAIKNSVSGSVREEKISISTNYLLTIKQKD